MAPDLKQLEEAAAWRARLAVTGQATTPPFERWLAADPGHAAAWRQVDGAWQAFGHAAAGAEGQALGRRTLARAARRSPALLRRPGRLAAAAALVLALGLGAAAYPRGDTYETAAGERRTLTLADGSQVVLDSGARLRVRLGRAARDLELVRGQARFKVAHDAERPFTVSAGDRRVTATGTEFNVDRLGEVTLVTLIEGSVSVTPRNAVALPILSSHPDAPTRLRPGQQLVSAGDAHGGRDRVAPVDLAKALAWETGQIVFEDEPLASVAARVSRYSDLKLEVSDPAVAELKISGVFNAGDVATFLDAVQRHLPVEAEQTRRGHVLLRRRPA